MKMDEYLKITRHAASTLIEAFTHEWKEHERAAKDYNAHAERVRAEDRKKIESENHGDAREALLALKAVCDAWQGLPAEYASMVHYQEERLVKLPSTAVLCGGLLQIGKAGLSIVHGEPVNWPAGRQIAGEKLSNVIRAARNQAMHYDEGNFKSQVKDCFAALAAQHGDQFDLGVRNGENLSIYVIDLLKWYSLDSYEADMMSLA